MHHNTVVLDQVAYTYPDGHPALQEVSLWIHAGEKVGLIGPNGAGKSTLLLLLNGLLRPQQGTVRVCGLEVNERHLPAVRQAVGLVFQDPNDQLFCPTVFEDVAFGPRYQGLREADIHTRVVQALRAVGLEGYEPRASYRLSLGEKKRVAIATVLSMQPDILVLDEPSAGLDPRARRALVGLLQTLHPTLLVATHDLALVREVCTRVVVLSQGRVVADGAVDAVLSDAALLERHGLA